MSRFHPLSHWRPDVLVSSGVSDRLSESEVREAIRAHRSYRSHQPTRVQLRHGSVIVASDPRSEQTLVLRPDEWRQYERLQGGRRGRG